MTGAQSGVDGETWKRLSQAPLRSRTQVPALNTVPPITWLLCGDVTASFWKGLRRRIRSEPAQGVVLEDVVPRSFLAPGSDCHTRCCRRVGVGAVLDEDPRVARIHHDIADQARAAGPRADTRSRACCWTNWFPRMTLSLAPVANVDALVAAIPDRIAFDSNAGRRHRSRSMPYFSPVARSHCPRSNAPAARDSQAICEVRDHSAVVDLGSAHSVEQHPATMTTAYRDGDRVSRSQAAIRWPRTIRSLGTRPDQPEARHGPGRCPHTRMRSSGRRSPSLHDWLATKATLSRHVASTRRKRLRRMM